MAESKFSLRIPRKYDKRIFAVVSITVILSILGPFSVYLLQAVVKIVETTELITLVVLLSFFVITKIGLFRQRRFSQIYQASSRKTRLHLFSQKVFCTCQKMWRNQHSCPSKQISSLFAEREKTARGHLAIQSDGA